MKRISWFLVLLALTAAALLWNELGMERHLALDTRWRSLQTVDDGSSGGKSSSSVRRVGTSS